MSDEPKKSRAWIGWAMVAVLVLYPLSLGPAAFVVGTGAIGGGAFEAVYLPLLALAGEGTAADRILRAYSDACLKAGERATHR